MTFAMLETMVVEIYLREGAETRRNKCYQDTTLWLKFIPVRGRKLPNKSSNNHPWGWNLSPWGDGNPAELKVFGQSIVEIYPREGTETRTRHRADQPAAVEIYPREGTETKLHGLHLHAVWLKFIPVRGRKPSCSIQIIMCNNWNLSPRGDWNVWRENHKIFIFPNLNDKFNPKGLYKKGKMC